MKIVRVLLSGVMLWSMVAATFFILSFVPRVKESESVQMQIIALFLLGYSFLAATFYYTSRDNTNGAIVGLCMSVVALLMDATITVPFVEIPNGRGYGAFFSNPLLWVLVIENIVFVYFYWKWRSKSLTECRLFNLMKVFHKNNREF